MLVKLVSVQQACSKEPSTDLYADILRPTFMDRPCHNRLFSSFPCNLLKIMFAQPNNEDEKFNYLHEYLKSDCYFEITIQVIKQMVI